jgi:cell division protein ZapE
MLQNIIDNLKNQDIKLDLAQSDMLSFMSKHAPTQKNLFSIRNKDNINGFYTWGKVGRGKTLITKSFFNFLTLTKKYFHYIDFMHYVHEMLSAYSGKKNPIDEITKSLSKKYKVILIDEFQVEDIADAMIIGNILNKLIREGVYLYITSNSHPNNLYKNGLQREKFIDAMKNLQSFLYVYELNSLADYRTRNIASLNQERNILSNNDIKDLIIKNFQNINFDKKLFTVNGRSFSCKANSKNFIWLSFSKFFNESNGNRDYIEISKNNDWIFISDFVSCNDDNADIARRFISFIDICYRDKTKIKFFFNEINNEDIYKDIKLKILWERCLSRLIEMQTKEYLI